MVVNGLLLVMASLLISLMANYELTEEECKREVSDADIAKIASSIDGKWKTSLPPLLGMDPIVVTDIIGAPSYICEEDRRFAFFREWKQQKGFKATYISLISALLEIKCTQDAGCVCKILKENTSTSTAFLSQSSASTNVPVATAQEASTHINTTSSLSTSDDPPTAAQNQVTDTTSASVILGNVFHKPESIPNDTMSISVTAGGLPTAARKQTSTSAGVTSSLATQYDPPADAMSIFVTHCDQQTATTSMNTSLSRNQCKLQYLIINFYVLARESFTMHAV